MVDGAAADTGPDQPDWIDVAQASVQWVVAKQSVYARVKAGTVRSRRLDGMLQVAVRDLNRHYARRETDTETDSEDAGWVRADLLASEQGRRRFAEGEAKALHVQLGNMGEQVKLLNNTSWSLSSAAVQHQVDPTGSPMPLESGRRNYAMSAPGE